MPADLLHLDAHPDLILYNGRIYTVDPTMPWAEASAIRGKTVSAIGSNAAVRALANSS